MADFGSALWNKPASGGGGGDSTPAEDPVVRSLRFDGSAYLHRTVSSSETTWTLAFWMKRAWITPPDTNNRYVFSINDASGLYWGGSFVADGTLGYFRGGSSVTISTAKYTDPSSWYHVCLVCSSSTANLYINGELSPNMGGMSLSQNTVTSIRFANYGTSSSHKAEQYLADIYFIEGEAKSPTDFIESNNYGGYKPKAYTGSFGTNGFHIDAQPAHDADLLVTSVSRNDGDTDFVDVAAGHTITDTGDPEHSIAVGNPFTGDDRAIYFDGNNDTVAVTTGHSDFAFGTGDFTVEGWYYFKSIPSGTDAMLVDLRPTNSTDTDTFAFSTDTTNGVKVYSGANYTLGGSLSTNTWHHIALVRDSGTLYAYIDGTATGTTRSFSNDLTANSTPRLGATADAGTSAAFTGYIFDVRITKGTARYTSNFTPPTSKLETEDSDTKLLIQPHKDDTNFHDETSNSHALSVTDSPTRTASTPYEAAAKSTAMYFDGNDNITTSTSTDLAIASGDSFTAECWVYFNSTHSTHDGIFSTYGVGDVYGWVIECTGGYWGVYDSGGGRQTSSTAATTGEWHHVALVKTDNTSNGARLYLNGNKINDVTVSSNITSARSVTLGNYYAANSTYDIDGYIFDARFTKGEEKYTGSTYTVPSAPFELNPVYLGGDQSGNKNHFEPTSISQAHDVLIDNPFKNHPTWNPLVNSSNTFSEGNLKVTTTSSTPAKIVSTIGASSGKWYAELLYTGQANYPLGVTADNRERDYLGNSDGNTSISFWTGTAGTSVYINGSSVSFSGSSTTWANGDIIGIALNADDEEVSLYKNGSLVGAAVSYSSYNWTEAFFAAGNYVSGLVYHANFGADPTFAGNKTSGQDTSQSEFYYAPPTGFKSLNTSNLAAPSVAPSEHFGVLTYVGNSDLYYGSGSTQNVTGVNFDVGMAWIKDRDNSAESSFTGSGSDEYGNYLFDTITGTSTGGYNLDGDVASSSGGPYLNSGEEGVISFSAGSGTNRGITVDQAGETNYYYDEFGFYEITERYVAWLWKLGSTGSSSTWNSSYTAPSTEHYNSSAGVTTIEVSPASSGNLEVAHSLSAAPEFFFVADDQGSANFSGFPAFHKDLSSGNYLQLDGNSAQSSDSTYFPSGAAHADYIKLGSAFIDDYGYGFNLRIWAFTGVEGYSKFGKMTGNGSSSDGVFCYLGFRPALVITKNISNTSGYHWRMWDSARGSNNVNDEVLYPSSSLNESTSDGHMDFLSNGFKLRSSAGNLNNDTYIFAAWAEQPFAAPSNAR